MFGIFDLLGVRSVLFDSLVLTAVLAVLTRKKSRTDIGSLFKVGLLAFAVAFAVAFAAPVIARIGAYILTGLVPTTLVVLLVDLLIAIGLGFFISRLYKIGLKRAMTGVAGFFAVCFLARLILAKVAFSFIDIKW